MTTLYRRLLIHVFFATLLQHRNMMERCRVVKTIALQRCYGVVGLMKYPKSGTQDQELRTRDSITRTHLRGETRERRPGTLKMRSETKIQVLEVKPELMAVFKGVI